MDHDEDMDPEAEAKTPIVGGCPVIIEDLVFHLGDDYAHVTLLDRWVDGWRSMALVRIEEGEWPAPDGGSGSDVGGRLPRRSSCSRVTRLAMALGGRSRPRARAAAASRAPSAA